MSGAIAFRVLSKITRTRQTQQNRAHVARLGLGHIAEAEWPAFERGICAALTKEGPLLVAQLQRSLVAVVESDSSNNDGSDGLVFAPAVEDALGEFVRGYATRWGVWESAKTVGR